MICSNSRTVGAVGLHSHGCCCIIPFNFSPPKLGRNLVFICRSSFLEKRFLFSPPNSDKNLDFLFIFWRINTFLKVNALSGFQIFEGTDHSVGVLPPSKPLLLGQHAMRNL